MRRLLVVVFLAGLAGHVSARDKDETCPPHLEDWIPTDQQLRAIVAAHEYWMKSHSISVIGNVIIEKLRSMERGADYVPSCDPGVANLSNAILSAPSLDGVNLSYSVLENAVLAGASLKGANLASARLARSDLRGAELIAANLSHATLTGAQLGPRSNWPRADVSADLSDADLSYALLSSADLSTARLDNANLSNAKLRHANLTGSSVAGAKFAYTDLSSATYAPRSAPPDPYVAGIEGLRTVIFPPGEETGLVQLRDLLQKAGLRDLEREATFALERGKTRYRIADWRTDRAHAAEGIFRLMAFDWTTAYGLHPARALILIAALWWALACVYAVPIWRRPSATSAGAVCRSWAKDRLELREGTPTRDKVGRDERLHSRSPAAIGWAAYFSLLSAFQIGFREFSVGTWLSRAQPRAFTLEATGWVRTLSGIQSLLSVYLLAICILTYFGRPFQ